MIGFFLIFRQVNFSVLSIAEIAEGGFMKTIFLTAILGDYVLNVLRLNMKDRG